MSDSPFVTDDVHDVGREVLRRDLERDAGPGRRLVEQDRHVPATERRDLRDRAAEDLAHRIGRPHDQLDVGPGEDVDVEEVAMAPAEGLLVGR
jgi:hypothetical protein